jgi:hypothetical protein
MTYRSKSFILAGAALAAAAACDGGAHTDSAVDARPALMEAGALPASKPDAGVVPDAAAQPIDDCTWDPAAGIVTAALTGNNGAEITAPGTGAPADPELSKMVPVTVTVPSPGLQVAGAWVFRSDASDETAYSAIAVRNVDAAYACFISIENYHWRSATGADLVGTGKSHDTDYLTGSVGRLSSFNSDTCLGPGETGYFSDIRIAGTGARLYSDVASIELAFRPARPASPASGKLLVRDFQNGSCDLQNRVRFRFEDTSTESVETGEILSGWVLFFDPQGTPTDWGYMGQEDPIVVAPGASLSMPVHFAPSLAPGGKAHVFTDFQPGPPAASPRSIDGVITRRLGEIATSRHRLRADWLRARAGRHD